MKKTLLFAGITVALLGVVLVGNPVFAQNATSTARKAARLDQTNTRLQTKASQEITRRITALNKLQTKVQGMKRISTADKSSFTTTIQSQINLLNNLQTKISADADAATLKADVQSITKAYRIYALILPQVEITAGADKLASTTVSVSMLYTKLQTRITTVQSAGGNVATLQTLLADMQAKITDANTQSANATAGVANLKPDNGDKTIMAANTAALQAARTDIKTGTQDLKTAYADILKIRAGLKALSVKTTTTATTTSQ